MSRNSASHRLRIAYLCDHSPLDRNLYSGGNARMYDALSEHVGDVHILSNRWGFAEPVRRLVMAMPEKYNLRLRWRLHLLLAPIIARQVRRELQAGQYDVLFSTYSFQSLYRVRPPYPMTVVHTSDATPTVYRNSEIGASFGSFFSLSRLIDPLILRAERATYRAADLLLWPSDWLRDGANETYGLDPAKALTVPWGANIEAPDADPTPPQLSKDSPLHLLFVGRDWYAKGGHITAATLAALRSQGVDAHLTVIGTEPPPEVDRTHVTVHPSLNKAVPEELTLFTQLYQRSHFIVMPSMESYGFAFCEASGYGVPSLCFRAGGVPVRDGVNGFALPLGSEAPAFAEVILRYLNDPDAYDKLRASTRKEFEEHLNWDAWGRRVAGLLRSHAAQRSD